MNKDYVGVAGVLKLVEELGSVSRKIIMERMEVSQQSSSRHFVNASKRSGYKVVHRVETIGDRKRVVEYLKKL